MLLQLLKHTQSCNNAKLFSNAVQQETSNPQLITHLNTLTRPNLKFELTGHDFGICSTNVDTGVYACAVMSFDNVTSVDLVSTYATIVRTLRPRKSVLGPSESKIK